LKNRENFGGVGVSGWGCGRLSGPPFSTAGSPQTQQKKKTLLQRNMILVLLIKMVNYNYKNGFRPQI
jgi:hypothetical protein